MSQVTKQTTTLRHRTAFNARTDRTEIWCSGPSRHIIYIYVPALS